MSPWGGFEIVARTTPSPLDSVRSSPIASSLSVDGYGRGIADEKLEKVSEICADLPEAERELSGNHAGFRVRGRIFAWFLDDHHGDGIVAITCKVAPGRNAELVELDPRRFFIPSYSGARGWVALRLDTSSRSTGRRLPGCCSRAT